MKNRYCPGAGAVSPAPAVPGAGVSVGRGTVGAGNVPSPAGSSAIVAMAGGPSIGATATAGKGGSGPMGQAGRGVAGMPAAGSGAGEVGEPGPTAVASLSFDVTTSPVGNRYQPKNIGAIWVQDASGKLVKSLEVWAGIRRRHLTKYVSALSGGSVDAMSSATLSSHKTHHATWNLKDRSGAAAAPGKYTLVMELTDGDTTGRFNTVEFDTSKGPTSLSPKDAPSFSAMKLQLQ